jgi:hypothetical protein
MMWLDVALALAGARRIKGAFHVEEKTGAGRVGLAYFSARRGRIGRPGVVDVAGVGWLALLFRLDTV